MRLCRYDAGLAPAWNAFIAQAENATFLFHRDFMGYHAHRFTDHSLLAYAEGEVVAVFPANESGTETWSHQGLSYGGLVVAPQLAPPDRLTILRLILAYYQHGGFNKVHYKSLPSFYWAVDQENGEAAMLGQVGAALVRQDVNTVVDLAQPIHLQQRRRRSVKKAAQAGVSTETSLDFLGFWEHLLAPNLWARHQVTPVHTHGEMAELANRFPQCIRLHVALHQGQTVAGAVVFTTGQAGHAVAHAQYIAASPLGKELGALDWLFAQLLDQYAPACRWFSFGISTYNGGRQLNQGLHDWKMGFGGQICRHLTYEIACTAH